MPLPNFAASAACLDRQRLNSQRYEAWTILGILQYPEAFRGYHNHPAVSMWRGSETALKLYLRAVLFEWVDRGYQNGMAIPLLNGEVIKMPWWLGDDRVHSSHRSNLLRKNLQHYSRFGWSEAPNNIYFWPSDAPGQGRYRESVARRHRKRQDSPILATR
jgi:hypothetical protein